MRLKKKRIKGPTGQRTSWCVLPLRQWRAAKPRPEAEYQRELLAKQWFGKELPDWDEPCLIRYTETITTPRGTSILSHGKQKDGWPGLVKSQIFVNDDFLPALTSELPRQVECESS